MFDITIIGAGVIGCSIARELSRYNLKICVIEKKSDVAEGTTKANSAIIHAGYDAKPATLKGVLNSKGNIMFDRLSKELDFPFKRNGSLVLCMDENDLDILKALKDQGHTNGVPGLCILNKEEVKKLEPNVSDNVAAALFAPSGGIVCPYEMTIALAENAYINGVEFQFDTEVKDIKKKDDNFIISCNKGVINTRIIINSAGIFSDDINNMISENKIKINPRRGEYCLFDKAVGGIISKTLFQLPNKMGKGILVTPTIDGNLLMGPTAVDTLDKENVDTSQEGMDEVLNKAKMSIKDIPARYIINSFSGLRAHSSSEDFIIGEALDAPNFINAAGIESPGLSSAPAIAEMIAGIVIQKLSPEKKANFDPIRKGIPKFREMNNEKRKEIISSMPSYGRVICRCEMITEGEIINAIRRPLGARTLDGVKRRTRAGMGRCQSGFCSTKIVDILSKELNLTPEEITKFGGKSRILTGKIKSSLS